MPHYFDITAKASKEVLDLSDYSEGARVVIEHPIWFHREEEAVVTLFKRDLRVMSCAISDKNRHQRHPFFGDYLDNAVSTVDYDDVWIERRGVLLKNGFYRIPLDSRRRDLSEVASKKRGMYRNRYQMLDDLSQKIVNVSTLD